MAIDYDPGASEVNQLNRIKLMIATAFGLHKDEQLDLQVCEDIGCKVKSFDCVIIKKNTE